jgi:CRP-like cAMP-binding protein
MRLESQVETLSSARLFSGLPSAKLRLLACMSEQLAFKAGEFVFRTGDKADAVYLILKGEVEFLAGRADGALHLITLGAGETFGEVSILAEEDRHNCARAVTDLTVIRLAGDSFFRLLQDDGMLALTVAKNIARRLAHFVNAECEMVDAPPLPSDSVAPSPAGGASLFR